VSNPIFLPLSLARAVDTTPREREWLHEYKLDGYRIEAVLRDGTVQLFTRNANDWSAKFSRVAFDLATLPVASATLDGEIVAVDAKGAASFQRLQQRIDAKSDTGVRYHVFDLLTQVIGGQHLTALLIDHRALLIHHIVVFQHFFTDVKVLAFNTNLCLLDRRGNQFVFDWLIFRHIEPFHQPFDAIAPEAAHQIVFQRQIEARRSRIALATTASAQLIVDPARFMPLRADHMQATRRDHHRAVTLAGGLRDFLRFCPLFRRGFRQFDPRVPPSRISTPRPAMLVAIVTVPGRPACAINTASRSCCLAFNTLCSIRAFSSSRLSFSVVSIDTVPTSTGCRFS